MQITNRPDVIAIRSQADALEAVVEARQAIGMSQAELEIDAGLGEAYIGALNAGRYALTVSALTRILFALGLTLAIVRDRTISRSPAPARTRREIVIRETAPRHDYPVEG